MNSSQDNFISWSNIDIEKTEIVILNPNIREAIEDHQFLNYGTDQFYKYSDGDVSFEAMVQPETQNFFGSFFEDLINHPDFNESETSAANHNPDFLEFEASLVNQPIETIPEFTDIINQHEHRKSLPQNKNRKKRSTHFQKFAKPRVPKRKSTKRTKGYFILVILLFHNWIFHCYKNFHFSRFFMIQCY